MHNDPTISTATDLWSGVLISSCKISWKLLKTKTSPFIIQYYVLAVTCTLLHSKLTHQVNRHDLARPDQHFASERFADDAAVELLGAIQCRVHSIQEPGQEIDGVP